MSRYFLLLMSLLFGQVVSKAQLYIPDPPLANPLPLILLLDCSDSMNDAGRIDQVNESIVALVEALQRNQLLRESIELGVVAFNTEARTVRELSSINGLAAISTLEASGKTNMGKAIEEALFILPSSQSDLRPVVIMITDGMPSDSSDAVYYAQQIQQRAEFFTLGVNQADEGFLTQIVAEPQLCKMLNEQPLPFFFEDMLTGVRSYVHEYRRRATKRGKDGKTQTKERIPFRIIDTKGWSR